jgi:phospholipid transport system substrate-binding protein
MRHVILSLIGTVACGLPALQAVAADPAPAASTAAAAQPGLGPQQLIEKVAQDLLNDLNANRDALTKDPAGVRALVDKHLLPHFDTSYSARLVLGTHWRMATPEQRQRFIDGFYQSLLSNYGTALLEFTADRMTILPFKGDPAASSATVRTEVKRSNGTPVPVNYSLRKTPQGWKAWDVTIEGISYVKNFRTDFGSEIDQKGLDAVIQRLEAQNSKPVADAKPAAASK